MKGAFDLNEKRQIDGFENPIPSILRIKLNGKRNQKVRFALHKIIVNETSLGQRPHITSIQREIKGNSKLKFNLESDASYSFIVQPDPFRHFIVEYSNYEYNYRSDRLFQIGLALFTTGWVIYFST